MEVATQSPASHLKGALRPSPSRTSRSRVSNRSQLLSGRLNPAHEPAIAHSKRDLHPSQAPLAIAGPDPQPLRIPPDHATRGFRQGAPSDGMLKGLLMDARACAKRRSMTSSADRDKRREISGRQHAQSWSDFSKMFSLIFIALGKAVSKASCVITLPVQLRSSPSPLLTHTRNLGAPTWPRVSRMPSRRRTSWDIALQPISVRERCLLDFPKVPPDNLIEGQFA
jgi:hypothetical protein